MLYERIRKTATTHYFSLTFSIRCLLAMPVLVAAVVLFIFMLVLLRFCVAAVYR